MTRNANRDGWIRWSGKGKPPTSKIEIRLRNGDEWKPSKYDMDSLDWKHKASDPGHDIVAYRKL